MNRSTNKSNRDLVLDWDYQNEGYHFITLCTLDGVPYFGRIRDRMMGLSVQGCLAHYGWKVMARYYEQVECDELIIMPNHIHGILKVDELPRGRSITQTGTLIPFYKKYVMRMCHHEGVMVMWARGYRDEIIQDEESLGRIRQYIQDDPLRWKEEWANIW